MAASNAHGHCIASLHHIANSHCIANLHRIANLYRANFHRVADLSVNLPDRAICLCSLGGGGDWALIVRVLNRR